MATRDPRIDAYIDNAAGFAQPILKHLRALVLKTCPEVTETIKWRMPSFDHHGLLCGMAAFKHHCAFVLYKHKLVFDDEPTDSTAMGQFGRITSLKDLPSDAVIVKYLRKAMVLNEGGAKMSRPAGRKPPLPVPPDLLAVLKKNKRAATAFEKFPPGHRREYIEWITEAKREETRAKRLAQAVEWMADGKSRNWKYENC
jgi:uncharacterized protein YdeI (YjbR/CyaY-like superfamily)